MIEDKLFEFWEHYQLGYIGLIDIELKRIQRLENKLYSKLVTHLENRTGANREKMSKNTSEYIRVLIKAFDLNLI